MPLSSLFLLFSSLQSNKQLLNFLSNQVLPSAVLTHPFTCLLTCQLFFSLKFYLFGNFVILFFSAHYCEILCYMCKHLNTHILCLKCLGSDSSTFYFCWSSLTTGCHLLGFETFNDNFTLSEISSEETSRGLRRNCISFPEKICVGLGQVFGSYSDPRPCAIKLFAWWFRPQTQMNS